MGVKVSSPEPISVRFDADSFWVDLDDGRTLGIPLAWFPRLLRATAKQREAFFLSPSGIHWDEIDEDISVAGLLAGRGDMTRNRVEHLTRTQSEHSVRLKGTSHAVD